MTCGLPPVTGLVALISSPLVALGCNNGELMLGVGANTRDMSTINARLIRVEGVIHAWLVSHSITALRLALGAVFLGFGVLKYFPGVSPAAGLAEATIQQMTAGLIPGSVALVATATLECVIGVLLLVGRGLRLTVYLLGAELLGILSPVVLLPARLFAGPYHAPTLEGQYVLKDVILVAASMVIATRFRGAKITHHTTNRGTESSADTPAARGGHGCARPQWARLQRGQHTGHHTERRDHTRQWSPWRGHQGGRPTFGAGPGEHLVRPPKSARGRQP